MLIAMQRPDATQVAGYRAWQALGRQVRAGEKALRIFAPMTRKATDEERDDNAGERKVLGFKKVAVFDVAQTEGDRLPDLAIVERQRERHGHRVIVGE